MRIEARAYEHPDAQRLVERLNELYRRIYDGPDRDPTESAQFVPPDGLFLVGYRDDEPIACGGWRRRPNEAAEIKRMYVAEHVRGHGYARQMLAELERTAGEAGATTMVLNTGYRQTDAMALYESSGYAPTEDRFGVYAEETRAFFYVKALNAS